MSAMQKFGLMAMTLTLGAAVLSSVDAESSAKEQAPINSDERLQYADARQEYGIRPADGAGSSPSESTPTGLTAPTDGTSLERSSAIKSDGGIRYVSGGIGESERTELNALSNQFNLHLMFATQGSGEYLSAVRVDIQDSHHGSVLTAQSKGPWFFAQLPPGNYTVEVTPVAGHTGVNQSQRKDFHIADSGQSRFDFYWRKAQ